VPNEDSHWDTSNGYINANKDYQRMKEERVNEGIRL